VLESSGPEVAREILERLRAHATVNGIDLPFTANTPYAKHDSGAAGAVVFPENRRSSGESSL